MFKFISLLGFTFFSFVKVQATLFIPLDSTTVHSVELSSRYQNRISVEEGRIEQIIHPGCDIDINLSEEIGQVFVYPLTNNPRSTSLTVITDEGKIQDFELNFFEKPAEIVILQNCIPCLEEICFEEECIDFSCPDYRIGIVKAISRGKIPDCFISCDTGREVVRLRRGVNAFLISKLVSLDETVYIWNIENSTSKHKKISEQEVNFQRGNWVYLSDHCLAKREHALAIIGVKNR